MNKTYIDIKELNVAWTNEIIHIYCINVEVEVEKIFILIQIVFLMF